MPCPICDREFFRSYDLDVVANAAKVEQALFGDLPFLHRPHIDELIGALVLDDIARMLIKVVIRPPLFGER